MSLPVSGTAVVFTGTHQPDSSSYVVTRGRAPSGTAAGSYGMTRVTGSDGGSTEAATSQLTPSGCSAPSRRSLAALPLGDGDQGAYRKGAGRDGQ